MRMSTIDSVVRPSWPVGYQPRKTVQEGDGQIAILCDEGDYKIIFDPTRREEVEAARASFDKLREQGFLAFEVKDDEGTKGEQIREFKPKMGRIILTPPMMGG